MNFYLITFDIILLTFLSVLEIIAEDIHVNNKELKIDLINNVSNTVLLNMNTVIMN